MLDVVLASAFVILPLATWWWSRSITYMSAGLILGFGVGGNLVQSTIAWGASWNVRSLQALALAVMVGVLAGAPWVAKRSVSDPGRRQLLAIGVPIAAIGLFLIAMRVLAPEDPGVLTGFGYLMNHPMGEDNAKFLNLAAQLTDGRTISFNGYAAGPLLLLMSVVASGVSVLSMILLGGVNQVAVVLNTVIGTQHLLMILTACAFAPFADRIRSRSAAGGPMRIPVPAMWLGTLVLFLASAVLTEYGHVSLQFVLFILVLWVVSFAADSPWQVRLALTLAIATSASVWIPLNLLGFVIVIAAIVWSLRRRRWWAFAMTAVTLIVCWDALITSILFLFGIDLGTENVASVAGSEGAGDLPGALVQQSSQLFEIPGGTERATATLAVLALAAVVAAAVVQRRLSSQRALWISFLPFVTLAAYVMLITVADAIASGSAPNYGTVKFTFALVIVVLAAYAPLAVTLADEPESGMSPLRWVVVLGVLVVLMADTLLPRALGAISPVRWGGIDEAAPIFWAAAEVKPTGDQDLSTLPIACLVAPPVSEKPTALPWGQESYGCTRILVGMNGLEGTTGFMVPWLGTEWSRQQSTWDQAYASLERSTRGVASRQVIMIGQDAELVGLTTFSNLLRQNPPTS